MEIINFIKKILIYFFLGIIGLYRLVISPFFAPACRFVPTCSEYAKKAFQKHGLGKGFVLTVKRLSKCHPWGDSGIDEVP